MNAIDLKDRVAVVTGGARGIGFAIGQQRRCRNCGAGLEASRRARCRRHRRAARWYVFA